MAKRRPNQRSALRLFYETARASEYDDAGFLGIQVDADGIAGGGQLEAQVQYGETLHPYGFFARPPATEIDDLGEVAGGCGVLVLEDGGEDFTFTLGDSRVVPILATAQFGESIQYGAAANFVRCHADGRVSRFATTDATPDGQTVMDVIGPTGYTRSHPWAVLRDDATGFHWLSSSGARLDMGPISGLPAPFDAFATYFEVQAATMRFTASAIQLGVGAGAQPVAKATTTLATLTSISAALTAVGAALSAITGILANAAAAPASAAAVTAIGAAVTAIGAAAATLPSVSTTVT